jgi:hypothetical protein
MSRSRPRRGDGSSNSSAFAGGPPQSTVILRESGVSSTLRPFASITDVSEYWIARLRGRRRLDTRPPSRDARRPSSARTFRPKNQRAWGTPGARCTRSPVCKSRKHTGIDRRYTGTPGVPARNGFNGFLRALPGDRACLPPSPPRSLLLRSLTPASGRQDHTTSPSAGPHHSSARRLIAHRLWACPAITYPRLMSPRPPHPAPRQ